MVERFEIKQTEDPKIRWGVYDNLFGVFVSDKSERVIVRQTPTALAGILRGIKRNEGESEALREGKPT